MDQHDDNPTTDPAEEPAPTTDQDTTEAVPSPTDASEPGDEEVGAPDPVEPVEPVEPEPPARPADATPTPAAVPAEGPMAAAAHGASARPRPVVAKVTPVLAAVALAWVLRKLLTRSRS